MLNIAFGTPCINDDNMNSLLVSYYVIRFRPHGQCLASDSRPRGACSQCQGITSVIDNTEKESESITLSNDKKDDMKYIIQTAKEEIMAWIGHQLRLVNQEETKTNVINQLDDRSVVMVQDWAMK